jgi:hypothetical protein
VEGESGEGREEFPPIRFDLIESFLPYLTSSGPKPDADAFLDSLGYPAEEREKHRRKRVNLSSSEHEDVRAWFESVLDGLSVGEVLAEKLEEFGRCLDGVMLDYECQEEVKEALLKVCCRSALLATYRHSAGC